MRCHSICLRLITLVMACVMLAGVLAACGQDAPATTEGTKPDATTESVPETTVREVTVVGDKLRHMTYNIAGSTGTDRVPNFDTNETKRENLKKYILEIDPDTFGVQEAPRAWIDGLPALLDNKYTMVGGNDSAITNEKFWFNPIYYKTDKFNCIDSGVKFLNEGFTFVDNNRNCAYALLERISDGERILVVSLHLEHRGLGTDELKEQNYFNYYVDNADQNCLRDEQVSYLCQVINDKLTEYYATYDGEISVIVSGDFNINYWTDEDFTHEYTRLCQSMAGIEKASHMRDSATVAANLVTNQTREKWTTYRGGEPTRIDFIFMSNNLVVDSYTVFDTPTDTGVSSDHHPSYTDYFIGH